MLYVKCVQSKKDSTKSFPVLCLSTDTREVFLSFDVALMSELTDLPVSKIRNLTVGETIKII